MLTEILTTLAGGATGVIGSISSRALAVWEKKEERKTLVLTQAHELQMTKLNIVAKKDIATDANASQDLQASYVHDAAYTGLLRWVRPVLTVLLIFLSSSVYFTLSDPVEKASVAAKILYVTTAAILWWFTDRSKGAK